jgi:hypothetical protein
MKETEFKVLMHSGNYVNVNKLLNGIHYCADIPRLFHKLETIESLILFMEISKEDIDPTFPIEKYIESLKQCELIKVKIIEA